MLRPLPATLPLRRAALIEPASVAWHAAARAGSIAGRSALVVGAGPIGLMAIAVLARAGADQITAVDLHDAPLALAARLGATHTLPATNADAIASTQADLVIESSGSPRGLRSAILACTRGGRVVLLGLLPSGEQPVLVSLITNRELELVGSFRFNDEIEDVIGRSSTGAADRSRHHQCVRHRRRLGGVRAGRRCRGLVEGVAAVLRPLTIQGSQGR